MTTPAETARRERYALAIHDAMEADLSLIDEDPAVQAVVARAAEAAAAVADAEIPAVLRAVADLIESDSEVSAAVHATTRLRRLADEMQRTTDTPQPAVMPHDRAAYDRMRDTNPRPGPCCQTSGPVPHWPMWAHCGGGNGPGKPIRPHCTCNSCF